MLQHTLSHCGLPPPSIRDLSSATPGQPPFPMAARGRVRSELRRDEKQRQEDAIKTQSYTGRGRDAVQGFPERRLQHEAETGCAGHGFGSQPRRPTINPGSTSSITAWVTMGQPNQQSESRKPRSHACPWQAPTSTDRGRNRNTRLAARLGEIPESVGAGSWWQ